MKVIYALLLASTGIVRSESPPPFSEPRSDDLKFMTSVVKHYQVNGVSGEEALERLCEGAQGKEHHIAVDPKAGIQENSKITLDLHDVPVTLAIGYIAELAGARWKYWGWPGGERLELKRITAIDDTELFHEIKAFECTAEGAKNLGLHPGMTAAEVRALLARCQISFTPGTNAYWDDKTHYLAVRNHPDQNVTLEVLVRMANKGFEFVRSPAKEESHKK